MEIGANVNPGTGKPKFSKIPFENRINRQFQIVVCDRQLKKARPLLTLPFTFRGQSDLTDRYPA